MARFDDLAGDAARAGRVSILVAFREGDRAAVLDALDGEPRTRNPTYLGDAEGVGAALALSLGAGDLRELGARVAAASDAPLGLATNRDHPDLPLEALIDVGLEGLRIAVGAGGRPCAVHSEVYEIAALRARGGSPEAVPAPILEVAETAPAAPSPEADDPFAYDLDGDLAISPAGADTLTRGIAPGAAPAAAGGRDAIDERRIAKLLTQLEESEREIEALRRQGEADPGVPSAFREVQGLEPDDPQAGAKRGVIDMLFREHVGESGEGAPRKG